MGCICRVNAYAGSRESYPVSADPSQIPDPDSIADADLAPLLEAFMTRQVVHVGYGDVLTDPVVGRAVRSILAAHAGEYTGKLAGHIGRHLVAFNGRAVG